MRWPGRSVSVAWVAAGPLRDERTRGARERAAVVAARVTALSGSARSPR